MHRYIIAFCLLWIATGTSLAQNEEDALRYSFLEPIGNARFTGMAGSMGALGGDFSASSWNPASTGIYRRNELGLTFGISGTNTDATYEDRTVSTSDFQFHIPQFGLMGSYETSNPEWTHVNFGVGYNKLVNFNQEFVVNGEAANTSMLDVFLNQANGVPFDQLNDAFPFGAGLAWNTFLLDTASSATPDQFISAYPGGPLTQRMQVTTSGHMGETVLTIGANRLDKLYLGATLGFPVVRFNREIVYTEDEITESSDLANWRYQDDLISTGNGINIKLGVIYRATKWLRLGGAYHSPTSLSFSEVWDTEVSSSFQNGDAFESFAQGGFDYNLRTPGRYIASAGFVLGKYGLINADYEYIDYSNAKLKPSNLIPDPYDFALENQTIESLYRGTHNVRIGGEARIRRVLRLRGGFAYQQHPYANGGSVNAVNVITYSGGIGLRFSNIFIETAYQLRQSDSDFYMYDPSIVDVARLNRSRGEFMLSLGIRY